jgi:nickel-dependent lactate racemase
MRIPLAYGRDGLEVDVPDSTHIIKPKFVPGLSDEPAALRDALRQPIESAPLSDQVKPGNKVAIVHTDITRATPNERILPILLGELEAAGIDPADITLINGLGTHRKQTEAELRVMLGDHTFENYRCIQHDCYDDSSMVSLGETSNGHPVRINRTYLDADVRILTGFIEPHFFAGFSGGPKAVLPSLAGWESVFSNHGQPMIAHPKATWGITDGNPIWEEMREVALRTHPTFSLMVALNTGRQITGIFAGDMLAAHALGCDFVRQSSMAGVDALYDIVVTTNGGYPLDQNLYQSIKGVSAANEILREGGTIILAAACQDGLPNHGGYAAFLAEAGSAQGVIAMLAQPGFSKHDQWQVQIQAKIQMRADVYVYSHGLTDDQIAGALFKRCHSIEKTVAELQADYGPAARICALPEGPQTIPYLLHGLPEAVATSS